MLEQAVADVFEEVLGIDRVGADDDFFALGGNSLLATQVVARLSTALETRVAVRTLFEAPTVEALAARMESHVGGGGRRALEPVQRPAHIPLSLAQQRMWFLNRFDPESGVNNIPVAVRLTGHLSLQALRAAIRDVLSRHEILRTVYPEVDGVATQMILPASAVKQDLTVETVVAPELLPRMVEFVSAGFDVTAKPPVRAGLFMLSKQAIAENLLDVDCVLVFVVHHIASDGFSTGPLARDVMLAYNARVQGETPGWSPLPVQFADFALWQREVLGSESDPKSLLSEQISYWSTQLAGMPSVLDLPKDFARPAVASYAGAVRRLTLSADFVAQLNEVARASQTSLFMVVHTALAVLLARLSGTADIAIGTPVAGRGERELDDMIGMFVNTLVLRTKIEPGATFGELLAVVREVDLSAFAHADLPFERLVEVIGPERSQAYSPLFQVMLTFQNMGLTRFELPDLTVSAVPFDDGMAKFDLQITLIENAAGGLDVQLNYATDLFTAETIDLVGSRYVRVLEAFAADVNSIAGEVPLTDARELAEIASWNETACGVDGSQTLVSLFERQVGLTPDAVAVVCEGECFTYAE
ncbi:MAG: condensation domain-containing protein, partial [Nocardiaceae bacterium]|nr:condensation domain-containing protein [Nocardiaceae bacterium]